MFGFDVQFIYSLVSCAFGIASKKLLPGLGLQRVTPVVSCKHCVVSLRHLGL